MSLKALMQKFSSAGPATATSATFATKETNKTRTAATVATVAVAEAGSAFAPVSAKPIDLAAFHERAAIIEYEDGLPRGEADKAAARDKGFDTAEALYLAAIEAWRSEIAATPLTVIRDFDKLAAVSLRFLGSNWAVKALAADWDETALFAVHKGEAPKERTDAWGLVPFLAWGIHRCTIEGFSRDACALRTWRGAMLRQPCVRANFDKAVPFWRHPWIVNASRGTAMNKGIDCAFWAALGKFRVNQASSTHTCRLGR
jgi:hypothetical protein